MYLKLITSENERKQMHDFKFVNLINDNEKNCNIVCVYNFGGKYYLLKSGLENDIDIDIGNVSVNDVNKILENGYCARSYKDTRNLESGFLLEKKEIDER